MSLRSKQRVEIGAGLPPELLAGARLAGSRALRRPCTTHAGSLRLPAVRRGRQVGAVGLAQEAIGRHDRGDLAHVGALWKRHDAGERDVHAERERLFGEPRRARKAVHHAAHRAAGFLAQDGQRVVLGFARVNDDGQIELARETDLQSEDLLLDVLGREIVVIVEPDFAERPALRESTRSRAGPAGRHRLRGR